MTTVTLGEICTIVSGGTPSRSRSEFWDSGSIPWIKIGNIKGKYIDEADEYITRAGLEGSSAKMLHKGTILYTIFATLGETGILTIDACTNQAIAGITIKNSEIIQTDYLYYYLRSKKNFVNEIGRGVAQNNINMAILRAFKVPIPEAIAQQHISSLLGKVEDVVNIRKQQLQKLDELIKARFVEMFGNGRYDTAKLEDVCKKITDGTHKTPTYLEDGVTFISAKNIANGRLDFSDVKHISEDEYAEIQRRCQTEQGDILLSKSGSLGAPVIVQTEERLGLFESLAVIKYDRTKLIPEFLCEQLKTERVQRQFRAGTKGVAIKHLHLGVIAGVDIIIPGLDEQQQFATFVKAIDKSKAVVQKGLDEAQLLFDSLMQQYFG